MFKPSGELVVTLLDASPRFVAELLLRAADAGHTEPAVDVEQAREVLGEQVSGEIGMVSRHRAAAHESGHATVITLASHALEYLDPEFEGYLRRYLGVQMDWRGLATVRKLLARDLLDWTQADEAGAQKLGVTSDAQHGHVLLECRSLEMVLPPLDKEG